MQSLRSALLQYTAMESGQVVGVHIPFYPAYLLLFLSVCQCGKYLLITKMLCLL